MEGRERLVDALVDRGNLADDIRMVGNQINPYARDIPETVESWKRIQTILAAKGADTKPEAPKAIDQDVGALTDTLIEMAIGYAVSSGSDGHLAKRDMESAKAALIAEFTRLTEEITRLKTRGEGLSSQGTGDRDEVPCRGCKGTGQYDGTAHTSCGGSGKRPASVYKDLAPKVETERPKAEPVKLEDLDGINAPMGFHRLRVGDAIMGSDYAYPADCPISGFAPWTTVEDATECQPPTPSTVPPGSERVYFRRLPRTISFNQPEGK